MRVSVYVRACECVGVYVSECVCVCVCVCVLAHIVGVVGGAADVVYRHKDLRVCV